MTQSPENVPKVSRYRHELHELQCFQPSSPGFSRRVMMRQNSTCSVRPAPRTRSAVTPVATLKYSPVFPLQSLPAELEHLDSTSLLSAPCTVCNSPRPTCNEQSSPSLLTSPLPYEISPPDPPCTVEWHHFACLFQSCQPVTPVRLVVVPPSRGTEICRACILVVVLIYY